MPPPSREGPSTLVRNLLVTLCTLLLASVPSVVLSAESPTASAVAAAPPVVQLGTLQDQLQLLQKQLDALTMRRREDYQLLEDHLKKFLVESAREFSDIDVQRELRHLKEEVRQLREPIAQNDSGKEGVAVKWVAQSIGELRRQMAEVQQLSSDSSRESVQRSLGHEELQEAKAELQSLRLEVQSLRSRQEALEGQLVEVQTEAQQSLQDLRRSMLEAHRSSGSGSQNPLPATVDFIEPEADHRLRHERGMRQQLHQLERAQHHLRHELRQLRTHHLEDRVRSLETEQRRLATSNFNLSREVASLDKMHSSVLQLLEDVEGVQTKFDLVLPEVRREISKLEFNWAQLNSQQAEVREEGRNRGKSIQALAVSVSALQAERDLRRVEEKQRTSTDQEEPLGATEQTTGARGTRVGTVAEVVQRMERIESEYEQVVGQLPRDCSQVQPRGRGLFLIAPQGQQHPVLVRCEDEWTVVQQRHDGSVDFNRSWEEYSQGFGSASTEFWVGNERLHHLTQDNCTRLRVEMQDIYDHSWYAEYGFFKVEDRSSGYRLLVSDYAGNASDALDYQNHMQFSAVDSDRDISNTHCAANYEGGWWFSHCQHANLNGRYNLGLTWFDGSRNEWIALKSSRMLVAKDPVCLAAEYMRS